MYIGYHPEPWWWNVLVKLIERAERVIQHPRSDD